LNLDGGFFQDKERAVKFSAIMGFSLLFVLTASQAFAQGYSLEESLIDLKASSQNIIESNYALEEKINNLAQRIPDLKAQLQLILEEKRTLQQRSQHLKDELRVDMREIELLQERFGNVEQQIDQINESKSQTNRFIGETGKKKQQYKSEAMALKNEINNLQLQFGQRREEMERTIFEHTERLKEMLIEAKRSFIELKAEYARIRGKSNDPLNELQRQKIRKVEFSERQTLEQDNLLAAIREGDAIRGEVVKIQREDISREEQLNMDIDALGTYEQRLSDTVNEGQDMAQDVGSRYRDRYPQLQKISTHLTELNRYLEDKTELTSKLLEVRRNLVSAMEQVQNTAQAVRDLESQVQEVVARQARSKKGILDNQNALTMVQKAHTELKREVSGIESDIQKMMSSGNSFVRDLKDDLMRSLVDVRGESSRLHTNIKELKGSIDRPVKELASFRDEQSMLKEDIVNLRKDLADLENQLKTINQEAEVASLQKERSVQQVDADIAELESYLQELQSLIKVVNEQYDAEPVNVKEFTKERDRLNTHLESLKNVNQALQEEMLTLMVTVDRLNIQMQN
jgi:chromosome segregation ATPase